MYYQHILKNFQKTADLLTYIKEILNGKIQFFGVVQLIINQYYANKLVAIFQYDLLIAFQR